MKRKKLFDSKDDLINVCSVKSHQYVNGGLMVIFKMPSMKKQEYDRLIEEEYICRIAFKGENHPYIAPFLYIFDGKFMYFLSTLNSGQNSNHISR